MNNWMIFAIITGIVLVAGIAIVNALADNATDDSLRQSCSTNANCPYGGYCNSDNYCTNPSCGAAQTGSCGCRG